MLHGGIGIHRCWNGLRDGLDSPGSAAQKAAHSGRPEGAETSVEHQKQ